jgi:hypothetical protein
VIIVRLQCGIIYEEADISGPGANIQGGPTADVRGTSDGAECERTSPIRRIGIAVSSFQHPVTFKLVTSWMIKACRLESIVRVIRPWEH